MESAMTEATLSRDGLRLHYRTWPTQEEPTARVLAVHGFGEHGGMLNYRFLAEALTRRGFEMWQADLRGHGRSEGKRGFIRTWDEFRGDLAALVRTIPHDRPLFLCGLSLGGLIVLEYAMQSPAGIAGVIAAGPPLGKVGIPPWLQALGKRISRWAPGIAVHSRLDLASVSRDEALSGEYRRDPLFHLRGTARLFTELLAAAERVRSRAQEFRVPLLILHGTDDRICPLDGAYLPGAPKGLVQQRTYDGARHNLFLETNRGEIFGDILGWMGSLCEIGQNVRK